MRDWARDSPTTAAPGIARSIIRFTMHVIPDRDDTDTADTMEAMRDKHLERARSVHSAQAGVPGGLRGAGQAPSPDGETHPGSVEGRVLAVQRENPELTADLAEAAALRYVPVSIGAW
ncbi:hypothetical protein [Streptomyces nigrescens]